MKDAESLDPTSFLTLANTAEPGWSDAFGGPEGIAQVAVELQEQLKVQALQLAAIRAAAINQMLKSHSPAEVARRLGISRQAAWKAAQPPIWAAPNW